MNVRDFYFRYDMLWRIRVIWFVTREKLCDHTITLAMFFADTYKYIDICEDENIITRSSATRFRYILDCCRG